jgi:hypothetical protein
MAVSFASSRATARGMNERELESLLADRWGASRSPPLRCRTTNRIPLDDAGQPASARGLSSHGIGDPPCERLGVRIVCANDDTPVGQSPYVEFLEVVAILRQDDSPHLHRTIATVPGAISMPAFSMPTWASYPLGTLFDRVDSE